METADKVSQYLKALCWSVVVSREEGWGEEDESLEQLLQREMVVSESVNVVLASYLYALTCLFLLSPTLLLFLSSFLLPPFVFLCFSPLPPLSLSPFSLSSLPPFSLSPLLCL